MAQGNNINIFMIAAALAAGALINQNWDKITSQSGKTSTPQAGYPSTPQAGYPSSPQASYPSSPQASYPSTPQMGYTQEVKAQMVTGCTNEAVKNVSSDRASQYCNCFVEKISASIPITDFEQIGRQPASPQTVQLFKQAVEQCGGDPSKVQL